MVSVVLIWGKEGGEVAATAAFALESIVSSLSVTTQITLCTNLICIRNYNLSGASNFGCLIKFMQCPDKLY